MLDTIRVAVKFYWRDLRSGQWITLLFALILSVAAITTLDFYTDRVKTGINQQTNHLLGGDLAVVSSNPIPADWEKKADALQLKHAQVWTYPSVAKANQQFQLVTIQAVSDEYPIVSTQTLTLTSGTIWVEPRLLPLLSIKQNDNIQIGDASFTISRLLTTDLDMLNTGWVIAPRILMPLKNVPATKTVLPGSRVEFRLLLAGKKTQLDAFRRWLEPQLSSSQRIITIRDQQSFIRNTLDQIDDYLQFVILICLSMSSVAIAIGLNHYIREHISTVALWRCLGMPQRQLLIIFISQLCIIAFIAGIIGTLMGFIIQSYISPLFNAFLPFSLPHAGWSPILTGFIISTFLLFAFSYPFLYELPRTSPLQLWRSLSTNVSIATLPRLITFIILITAMLFLSMDVHLITLFYIDIILLSIAVLYIINVFYTYLTKCLTNKINGPIRRGLCSLIQHPESASLQFSGITLILTCLLLLHFTQHNLTSRWLNTLPANTPNYFLFNIAPDDIPSLQRYFNTNNIHIASIYPMVRGRITQLNDRPILTAVPASGRQHNALHRELNLSWMTVYPTDNNIVSGTPWTIQDASKPYASIEKSMADSLQLKLGDKLDFRIGDKTIHATITNIRTVDWASFHPNFYVIFPPGLLDHFPATYITSFNLPIKNDTFLNGLTQRYPNITLIDMSSLFKQIQSIIRVSSKAVQYLLFFAIGGGVLVFAASLQSSMNERKNTWRLLHILGASRQFIWLSIAAELSYQFILIVITSVLLSNIFIMFILRNLIG